MKILFQYYTFDIKVSNNIFFGPVLMELRYLFMNVTCYNIPYFSFCNKNRWWMYPALNPF